MRNDHVATLPLVHWPAPVASWYLDLRRGATYSPVLGPLGHAQRLLPPDRPPLRDLPARARLLRHALPGPGRGPARSGADLAAGAAPSPASPVRGRVESARATGVGHLGRRRPDRRVRATGRCRPTAPADVETIDRDRPACRGGRRRSTRWSRSGPGSSPAGSSPARHGGSGRGSRRATWCSTRWACPGASRWSCPTRRSTSAPRARSAPPSSPTRGSAPWSTCRPSASPGCPPRPTSSCRPPRPGGSRPGAARSRTSRSSSRSTRPPAGSAA